MKIIAVAIAVLLAVAPAQAQFNGVTFTGGAANYPAPDFSQCDFNTPTNFTNIWYIDPVNGFAQNDYTSGTNGAPVVTAIGGGSGQGTAAHPWSNLNAVFTVQTGYPRPLLTTVSGGSGTLSPIAPGDEILLNTGTNTQYGIITTGTQVNPTYLTIAAAPGQSPILSGVQLTNSQRLHLTGVAIQHLAGGGGINVSGSKNAVLDNLAISVTDYATAATWTTAAAYAAGIGTSVGVNFTNASCIDMLNSHLFLMRNGIAMSGAVSHHLWLQGNELDHWTEDAIDYAGHDLVIDHNHLHDPVGTDNAVHMDYMQGFCSFCGKTNYNVWINANLEIFQEDPALPNFGVGAYDGGIVQTNDQWSNLFITNNLVSIGLFPHGIGVGGCNDCVVSGNTDTNRFEVNAADLTRGGVYASSHITVTNNIMGYSACTDPTVNETNNIIMKGTVTNSTVCFGGVISANFGATAGMQIGNNLLDSGGVNSELTNIDTVGLIYNFHLLSTAPARGFGLSTLPRPLSDAFGVPQNSPVDAGAIAYP